MNNKNSDDINKFFGLLLNNLTATELYRLFDWEIRTKITDELVDLQNTIISFNNLKNSGQLNIIKTNKTKKEE